MTTLENLWFGNITPFEQYLDGNEKYKEMLPIMAKDRTKLSEGFSHEQTDWLEKYDAIINEMHSIAEVEAFKYGYKLAINTLFEII